MPKTCPLRPTPARIPWALLLLLVLPGAAGRAAEVKFPDLPGFLTLQADFHQHTVFSDGKVWPNIRVDECIRDGLDAMAITDHIEWQPHARDLPNPDRNRSYQLAQLAASLPPGMSEGDYWLIERRREGREDLIQAQSTLFARPPGAEQEAKPQDLIVVNGAEITRPLPLGHVNALFLQDANQLVQEDGVAAVRAAAGQGAFLIWNHPWSPQRSGVDGIARLNDLQRDLMKEGLIQGIEVVNTDTYSPEAFQIALDQNLAIIGNSDIHALIDTVYPPGRKHRPLTLVFARERTPAALKEALVDRRTAVWFNQTLLGRARWLEPLVRASLTVRVLGYKPDRRRFSIQERPDTSLLDVELVNQSGTRFVVRPSGPFELASDAGVLVIEPHSSLRLTLPTRERLDRVRLDFGLLNVLTAPGQHLALSWELPVP